MLAASNMAKGVVAGVLASSNSSSRIACHSPARLTVQTRILNPSISYVSRRYLEVRGSFIQSPGPLPRLALTLNSGPFPPPALPGFPGLTGPSAIPKGRVQPSRVSRWVLTSPTVEDFPCRVVLSVHTCRRQYPGEASGCHCRSLPLTCQPSPRFPTGSAFALLFSESAQRSLLVAARVVAKPPKAALYTEGFDRFVTSDHSDCYRLERQLPGGSILPLRERTFLRRTRNPG
jgi:hypothetical protein